MTPTVSELLEAATRLSVPERAELVDRLLATLPPVADETSHPAAEPTFAAAAAHVLAKNRELYRRLA